MKILNLYACLGGNRYKWDEVTDIEVTAVELDPELARMYQERFPNDIVIVADAHQYLLDHYKEFDFIWTSPPCPSHSKIRISQKNTDGFRPEYPDMRLHQLLWAFGVSTKEDQFYEESEITFNRLLKALHNGNKNDTN